MTGPSDMEHKPLSPAAQRALAEAEARRAASELEAALETELETELGGPKGLNPRAMATGRKRASPTISER